MKVVRRLLIVPLVLVAGLVWVEVPALPPRGWLLTTPHGLTQILTHPLARPLSTRRHGGRLVDATSGRVSARAGRSKQSIPGTRPSSVTS